MNSLENPRVPEFPIDPLFLQRWSPRAFNEEKIPETELLTLFEAARWAPSSSNLQPWRFLYARRKTTHWDRFLGLLNPFNQAWAHRASALVVVVSNSLMSAPGAGKEVPSPTHSFDTGAAWAHLALQAIRSGWYAHAMAGFDRERAVIELNVPKNYHVEAAIAIGRRTDKSILSASLQEREHPNGRNPLATMVLEGGFPNTESAL